MSGPNSGSKKLDYLGPNVTRRMPLANLKREFSEAKWNEAKE